MQTNRPLLLVALTLGAAGIASSAGLFGSFAIDLPNTFQAGQTARASEVNANFEAIKSAVEARAVDVDQSLVSLTVDVDSLLLQGQDLAQALAELPQPQNVIHVSPTGADFTSVAEALASITDAAADNRYLVQDGPGVYTETDLVNVPSFVALRGAGAAATVVRSARSAGSDGSAAATLQLQDGGDLHLLTVENTATSGTAIGVFGDGLGRETTLADVIVRVTGDGGQAHTAVRILESDVTIDSSMLMASGADVSNTALHSTDSVSTFAQPLVRDCALEAKDVVGGVGLRMSNTAARVEGCRVEGWSRGMLATDGGISTIRDSRVASLGLDPVYEASGSASLLSGGVFFVGGDPVGLGSQFKYAHCIKSNFDVVLDGTGSTVEP